jgi:hypothetical protein
MGTNVSRMELTEYNVDRRYTLAGEAKTAARRIAYFR